MRNLTKLSIAALSAVAGLAACAGTKATDAASQDDFKHDLQLASSTSMDLASAKVNPALLNSLETKPNGSPEALKTVKKGAGNRAVHSRTPTVKATPEVEVAAVDDQTEQSKVDAEAPVSAPTSEPVAVAPRPSPPPVVVQSGGGSGDYGTGGNGGGVFGGGGGIGGVVIRGGGVDGDHCEPHGGRGGVYGGRGGVYGRPGGTTRGGGGIGVPIGIGTRTRFPLAVPGGITIRGR